ncbi:ribonuclease Z [archaeon]|nr:ribonuclease Z [archaeon]
MVGITFLGTADSIPSRDRNHTSILLNFNEENILIDCGEGTQRQFRKAKLNPCKITRILITHWHGDHVLGIPGLLSTLSLSGYSKTLNVYGPRGTEEKFWKSLEVFPFRREYKIIFNEISSGIFFENENFYLSAEEMEHGIPSLAYSFIEKGHIRIKPEKVKELGSGRHLKDLKEGKDVVINGKKIKSKNCIYKEEDKQVSIVLDTKLNSKIIPFVKNANILIGEATFSSELKKEAEEHMHLTVSQIAEIAKKAKANKLIITHISSRYLKNLKSFLGEAKKIFPKSYLAKDLDFFSL